jgi:predicted XRE-type DNA-binding protein
MKVYKLRPEVEIDFKNYENQKQVAEFLGISEKHLSEVLNRKANASKMLALSISLLNREGNLEKLFEEVK